MSSSTPSSPHISSHLPRSRASSDISVISPHLLHRPRTGRIQRNYSSSARVLSLRNQEAICEAATDRNWAQDSSRTNPKPSLPETIPPLLLSVPDFYTESESPLSLLPLRSLPKFASSHSLAELSRTASEAEVNRDTLWYDSKQFPDPPKTTLSGNSMEFMMSPQYNHFGSYSSSYQSNFLEQYSGADPERVMAHSSPQPSSYAPSYATSPAVVASSPALSPRPGSIENESGHHYASTRSPYAGTASSAQPGYGYASVHQTASMPTQYGSDYPTSNDPYNPYGIGYTQAQASYVPSQTPGYAPQYPAGSSAYEHGAGVSSEDAAGVRVVNSRPKPQCWDHGCNGRQFSTFSNLLRHQREKSGAAQKSTCPRCGAVFTRTTARNGHMAHDKCKGRSTTSTSEAE